MKKILLIILDGFGIRKDEKGNAIKQAEMPTFNKLWDEYPHSLLEASGRAVGLQKGQTGNCEIGHLSIGAGRLVKQNITQIEDMFNNNDLKDNDVYKELVDYSRVNNKPVHLMALLSDSGIHSHIKFILNIIDKLHEDKVKEVYVHAITDGKDIDSHSAYQFIKQVEDKLVEYKLGHVVSICGRYYAMDNEKVWEKTKYYSDMVTMGKGVKINNIEEAINICYKKDINDEILPPLLLDENHIIKDKDVLLWFNFKSEGAKQILNVLTNPDFDIYPRVSLPNLKVYSLYKINEAINSKHLIELNNIENSLGEYISKLGLTQARIAESEKFDHVTYYFDEGRDLDLPGCDHFQIPAQKVSSYDLKPEMSSVAVTKQIIRCLNDNYDFILANFANPDMVGHTGNYDATIKSLESVDNALSTIMEYAEENFYTVIITGDHGNVDYMFDEAGNILKSNSTSPVPFIITDKKLKLKDGTITNIAPTILKYMDIKIPDEMNDSDILIESN